MLAGLRPRRTSVVRTFRCTRAALELLARIVAASPKPFSSSLMKQYCSFMSDFDSAGNLDDLYKIRGFVTSACPHVQDLLDTCIIAVQI
jgi:hypothetical protein